MPTPQRYAEDLTGLNADNRVVNEPYTLLPGTNVRILVPTYSPFFDDSVIITDGVTGQPLVRNTQYQLVQLAAEAVMQSGKSISEVIVILDKTVSATGSLTYQTLGGLWVNNTSNLYAMYTSLLNDPRNVDWTTGVIGKPSGFNPTPHYHFGPNEVMGWGPLVNALAELRKAILMENYPVVAGLYDLILAKYADLMSGYTTADASIRADMTTAIAGLTSSTGADLTALTARVNALANQLGGDETSLNARDAQIQSALNDLSVSLNALITGNATTAANTASGLDTRVTALEAKDVAQDVALANAVAASSVQLATAVTAIRTEFTAADATEAQSRADAILAEQQARATAVSTEAQSRIDGDAAVRTDFTAGDVAVASAAANELATANANLMKRFVTTLSPDDNRTSIDLPPGTDPFSIQSSGRYNFSAVGSPNLPPGFTFPSYVYVVIDRHTTTQATPPYRTTAGPWSYKRVVLSDFYSNNTWESREITAADGTVSHLGWTPITTGPVVVARAADFSRSIAYPHPITTVFYQNTSAKPVTLYPSDASGGCLLYANTWALNGLPEHSLFVTRDSAARPNAGTTGQLTYQVMPGDWVYVTPLVLASFGGYTYYEPGNVTAISG